MVEIVIVAAKRTPQGRFLGALGKRSAVDLGVAAATAALTNVEPAAVELTVVGNVLSAGLGMNIARQVAVHSGVPVESPAFSVNMMCASGMQAAALAAMAIERGEAGVVLCGGAESMSNAPYLIDRRWTGSKLGDGVLRDALLGDGLVDAFDQEHMAITVERLAEELNITRHDQDEFAAQSQRRYATAQRDGAFIDELVAMDELEQDEQPRPDTSLEELGSLKTAFKSDGRVTAGNASGINDGAAMLVLADRAVAERQGWSILAKWVGSASAGCDPKRMGLGPVHATERLCKRYGKSLADFDTIEINEAFAGQVLACMKRMGLATDANHINTCGGAIALGHPIGASGARLLVHLAHRVSRGETHAALATLCAGGGMGCAAALAKRSTA